jgi:hypothetical protein
MHLVQLLIPLTRNDGSPQPADRFAELRAELVDRFGGVTAFSRAPAEGLSDDGAAIDRDRLILVEVMAPELDRGWWANYRRTLEARFEQEELMIRAVATERL